MIGMARRPRIPKNIETDILTQSRRRCALCFGLNSDNSEKRGQIAHIDHDPTNNALSNLAWLCLPHHDQYDSRSSQSKNITTAELIRYRGQLYDHWTEKVAATDNKNLAITVRHPECGAVSWFDILDWCHNEVATRFEIEGLIESVATSHSFHLVINGDWDKAVYTNIDSNIRGLDQSELISWLDIGQSAVLWVKFKRALIGSYIEITSINHDRTSQLHRRIEKTLFCRYRIEEINSISVWSIGGDFPIGSTFMLRKQ